MNTENKKIITKSLRFNLEELAQVEELMSYYLDSNFSSTVRRAIEDQLEIIKGE